MDTTTTAKQIEVMKAYIDGKPIEMQYRTGDDRSWKEINPGWNWALCDYRAKKVPREFVVVLDKYGMVLGAAAQNDVLIIGRDVKLASEGFTSIRVQEVL